MTTDVRRIIAEIQRIAILHTVPARGRLRDEELLQEIVRVHREIKKRPAERQMLAFSTYSIKPYCARWGTFVKAHDAAYELLGEPAG